jgi:hypothetical protein
MWVMSAVLPGHHRVDPHHHTHTHTHIYTCIYIHTYIYTALVTAAAGHLQPWQWGPGLPYLLAQCTTVCRSPVCNDDLA